MSGGSSRVAEVREAPTRAGTVKVTMNLPAACVEKVEWLKERLGVPNSHVVRRAVDLRHRIQQELDAGAKILIERDGELMTVWFE
jgi:hypothetical protein